jgi:CRP-like cAMP-binding protein
MSGKVIQTLRTSPLAHFLSEAELRMLAGCGQVHEYAAGQDIVSADGQDERLFLLREGKVDLYLTILTATRQCSGDAHVELSAAGEPFGWAAWMRADRVGISARALEATSLVVFDLRRLGDSEIFRKISIRMLELLYARLQEYGICPPNVQALLKFKRMLEGVGAS